MNRDSDEPFECDNFLLSCDRCENQETGGHYCLLLGRIMKNMDAMTCKNWTAEDEERTKKRPY